MNQVLCKNGLFRSLSASPLLKLSPSALATSF
jgi:hypothetical protein